MSGAAYFVIIFESYFILTNKKESKTSGGEKFQKRLQGEQRVRTSKTKQSATRNSAPRNTAPFTRKASGAFEKPEGTFRGTFEKRQDTRRSSNSGNKPDFERKKTTRFSNESGRSFDSTSRRTTKDSEERGGDFKRKPRTSGEKSGFERRESAYTARPGAKHFSGGDDRPPFKRNNTDRPGTNRFSGGGDDRPPFKRNNTERPGTNRFSGGSDDRPPFKRNNIERPGTKRFSGGGDDRPPFKRNNTDRPGTNRFSGGGDDRPPFKRSNTERPGTKRFSGGSDDRPPFKRSNTERPGTKRFSGGDDRPPFKRSNTERPGTNRFSGGDDRPPFKRSNTERPDNKRFSGTEGGKSEFRSRASKPKGDYSNREYKPRPDKFNKEEHKRGRKEMQQAPPANFKGRGKQLRETSGMLEKGASLAVEEVRLNRYIAMSGSYSRREADAFITEGRVNVNGLVVNELGTKVQPGDVVKLDGQRIAAQKPVYILLNKPKGYVTTTDDPEGRQTVMDLIQLPAADNLFPVGRLDRNTTGVLLITNDGDLAQKIMHPSFNIKKIYRVKLDRKPSREHMMDWIAGVQLEDGRMSFEQVGFVEKEEPTVLGVEIHSGRNRVVRRMFEHFGYEVKSLDRVLLGEFDKLNLGRGRWRFLNDKEMRYVMKIKARKQKSASKY
jgi:23S rRNA pseudouridine2605 synthase